MVEKEGFQYIKSELGLGFGMDDATGIAVDGVFGVKGLWSAPTSIGTLISGVIGDIYGGFHEEKVYDKGVKIAEQGSVLHLFNLYCVSNVVDKGGNEVRRSYSVYPSYQEKDSKQISTEECIENFNRNLGKEGIFKDAREQINFTEPLSMEKLLSEEGFEKTKILLEGWDKYTKENAVKTDDVTADLSGKGE